MGDDRGDGGTAREPMLGWLTIGGTVTVLVCVYLVLPRDAFGPHRATVSWVAFGLALALIALLLLQHIRNVLLNRPDNRSGFAITVLMTLTVLVFATAYLALAQQPGELDGLETHLDALYFTLVTLATVGYGDITPQSQSARLVVILQILYALVLLTSAGTALTSRLRARFDERHRKPGP